MFVRAGSNPVFLAQLVAVSLLSAACSPAVDARHPSGPDITESDHETLPRYYSLEVRSDGLWFDGERIAPDRLDATLERAARDPSARGAALVFYADDPPATELLERLARAGFTHVVLSGLSPSVFSRGATARDASALEPTLDSASAEAEPEMPVPRPPPPPPRPEPVVQAPQVEEVEEAPPPVSDVEIKHYGLHIGGGPNSEAEKRRYLAPIERRFEALRECHLLANDRKVQASFGVDLLVGKGGGKAKIRDYRTQLKGRDFQACVLGVLGEVSFPAPERATVVSYSVLFKPASR